MSDLEVIVMRDLRWNGRIPYSYLARMFCVSYRATWSACNGETHRDLPMPIIMPRPRGDHAAGA